MIYLLSNNFNECRKKLCDQHLNVSILDTGMAISYYLWINKPESVAFDASKFFTVDRLSQDIKSNIPRAFYPVKGSQDLYDWVLKSSSNYAFLIKYLIALTDEYLFRFLKPHKFSHAIPSFPKADFVALVDRERIENRISCCIDIYSKPASFWLWTNRDK